MFVWRYFYYEFFPAKPLGCYGDGEAVFTDCFEWAQLLKSYRVHGKGNSKYDNVRIGMNSRLDTLQATVILTKLPVFEDEELAKGQVIAEQYTKHLKDVVKTPVVKEKYYSSWAQYTIQLEDRSIRDGLQGFLKEQGIPSMVYYQKPMHRQLAFGYLQYEDTDYPIASRLSELVLSLPFHPYIKEEEIMLVANTVREYLRG